MEAGRLYLRGRRVAVLFLWLVVLGCSTGTTCPSRPAPGGAALPPVRIDAPIARFDPVPLRLAEVQEEQDYILYRTEPIGPDLWQQEKEKQDMAWQMLMNGLLPYCYSTDTFPCVPSNGYPRR